MKRWLVLFGSAWIYQVVCSAALVRIIPAQWLPDLGLVWLCALADRTPQTAARSSGVWWSGFFASVALGHLADLFLAAPLWLHSGLYAVTYVLVRVLTDKLADAHPLRLFLTLAGIAFGLQVAVWWTKALAQQFVTLSALQPWAFATHAAMTAALGVAVLSAQVAMFDDEQQARF